MKVQINILVNHPNQYSKIIITGGLISFNWQGNLESLCCMKKYFKHRNSKRVVDKKNYVKNNTSLALPPPTSKTSVTGYAMSQLDIVIVTAVTRDNMQEKKKYCKYLTLCRVKLTVSGAISSISTETLRRCLKLGWIDMWRYIGESKSVIKNWLVAKSTT